MMLRRLLAVALAAALLTAMPADAQNDSGRGLKLSVRKANGDDGSFLSRLRYSVPAGTEVEEPLVIQNISPTESAEYAVYVGDLIADGQGGADGTLMGAPSRAMGTWLSVSHDKVVLGPKGKQIVTLRMKVPADASPGDHAGYLFVQRLPRAGSEDVQGGEGKAAAALVIATRLGIPITQRVPGEHRRDLRLLEPAKKYEEEDLRIEYGVENPGNLLEFPDGRWSLKDPAGNVLMEEATSNWGIAVPGGRIVRSIVLPPDRPLVRGEYTLAVDGAYGPPDDRRPLVKEWKIALP